MKLNIEQIRQCEEQSNTLRRKLYELVLRQVLTGNGCYRDVVFDMVDGIYENIDNMSSEQAIGATVFMIDAISLLQERAIGVEYVEEKLHSAPIIDISVSENTNIITNIRISNDYDSVEVLSTVIGLFDGCFFGSRGVIGGEGVALKKSK